MCFSITSKAEDVFVNVHNKVINGSYGYQSTGPRMLFGVYVNPENSQFLIKEYSYLGFVSKKHYFSANEYSKLQDFLKKKNIGYSLSSYQDLLNSHCSSASVNITTLTGTQSIDDLQNQVEEIISHLNPTSNDISSSEIISLRVPTAYGFKEYKLKIALDKDGNITKFFLIGDGSEKDLLVSKVGGKIRFKDRRGNELISLELISNDEGKSLNFNIQYLTKLNPREYSKKNISLVKKGRLLNVPNWVVVHENVIDGQITLDGDRDPTSSSSHPAIKFLSDAFDATVGTVGAKFIDWFRDDGFEGKVKDVIIESAKESDLVTQYFTDEEIAAVADEVLKLEKPTVVGPYSRNDEVTRLSYKIFARKAIEKILKDFTDNSLNDDELKFATDKVVSDLNVCLDKANEDNEFAFCLEKFEDSAAYRVGGQVLAYFVRTGANLQKASNDEFLTLFNPILNNYKTCSAEKYFPMVRQKRINQAARITDDSIGDKPLLAIQSCLFGALSLNIDTLARSAIKQSSEGELDTQSISQIESILGDLKSCVKDKGFISKDNQKANHSYLEKISVEKFQTDLNDCLLPVTLSSGRVIVKNMILDTQEFKDNVPEERKDAVIEVILSEGFDKCIEAQKIKDPKKCESFITLVATNEIIGSVLEKSIREAFSGNENLVQKFFRNVEWGESNDQITNGCFDELVEDALEDIDEYRGDDLESFLCIKNSVLNLSRLLTGDVIKLELENNEKIKKYNIQLSDEQITSLQAGMYQCFKKELEVVKTLEQLNSSLDNVNNVCKADTFKKVIPLALEEIILQELSSTIEDPTTLSKIKADIIDQVTADLNTKKSYEEVDSYMNELPKVMIDLALKGFVDTELFKYTTDRNVIGAIKDELFGQDYELRLSKIETEEDQLKFINGFQLKAYPLIAPLAINSEVGEFVNTPEMQEEFNQIIVEDIDRFKRCLGVVKVEADNFNSNLELCEKSLKNDIVFQVIKISLNQELDNQFNGENPEAQQRIRDILLTDSLREEIAINLKDDSDESLQLFSFNFKKKAAGTMISELIKAQTQGMVSEDKLDPIISLVQEDFEKCSSSLTYQQTAEFDTCVSQAKKVTTFEVINKVMEEYALAITNPTLQESIVRLGKENLKSCFDSISNSNLDKEVDACSALVVHDFVKKLGTSFLDEIKSIRGNNLRADDMFNQCIQNSFTQMTNSSQLRTPSSESEIAIIKDLITSNDNFSFEESIESISNCALVDLKEGLLSEIKEYILTTDVDNIDSVTLEHIESIMDNFMKIIDSGDGSNTGGTGGIDTGTLLELGKQLGPVLRNSPEFLQNYAQEAKEFELLVRSYGESFDAKELRELAYNNNILLALIKSTIRYNVLAGADTLKEQGASDELIEDLSSKEMIDRIMEGQEGQEAFESIVEDFFIPMIHGQSNGLPDHVNEKIIDAVIADTSDDGFAMTLFSGIIQAKLDDERDMGGIKWFIANTFLGYSKHDFKWDGEKGLKDTPKGQEAFEYFRTQVLREYLLETEISLNESEMNKRLDHITELIKKAMKQN